MISVILAAGKGSRMKSEKSKLVHKVNGIPMIKKIDKVLSLSGIENKIYVLGYLKEQILEILENIDYVVQEDQLGTAHAVSISKEKLMKYTDDEVLICYGDGPLITSNTILNMKEVFSREKLDGLVLSCKLENPKGYGRIIKENNNVVDIREEVDANENEKLINEINTGVYIFKKSSLLSVIDKVSNNNYKNEYYLTDVIKLMNNSGFKVNSLLLKDKDEMLGVNSKEQLAQVSKILRIRKNKELMNEGVILIDPETTYIEEDVEIGIDTVVYPNVYIQGRTIIGKNCKIYSGSRIENSTVGDNVKIDNSIIESSIIKSDVGIGPFAHIRPDTLLENNVKVGNFVEIKKSILHKGVKCGHLTYIGDSEVGEDTNIGAGSITCNYDGRIKHKTTIGKNSFIGSNTIMVSPVNIGENVLTAAGSVITKDIPDDSLAFGRAKQVNKIGINKK